MYVFRVARDFFIMSSFRVNNWYNADRDQIFVKITLWSYKVPFLVVLTRKNWVIYWSHSKFSEVTWPSSYCIGRFIFTDQHWAPFYRFFCKIANHQDINLRFSGSISYVDLDNSAKFREVSMPRICISKKRGFCNL